MWHRRLALRDSPATRRDCGELGLNGSPRRARCLPFVPGILFSFASVCKTGLSAPALRFLCAPVCKTGLSAPGASLFVCSRVQNWPLCPRLLIFARSGEQESVLEACGSVVRVSHWGDLAEVGNRSVTWRRTLGHGCAPGYVVLPWC